MTPKVLSRSMPDDDTVNDYLTDCSDGDGADRAASRMPVSVHSARTPVALSLASAWLAACGGGGSSDSSAPAANPPAAPVPGPVAGPAPVPNPTTKEAARFMSQASLGATEPDLLKLQTDGYDAWLDQQIALSTDTSRWDWLLANGYNVEANVNGEQGLDSGLWRKLIASPDTLRQRLTIAWSEIFVVGATVNGNFRQFQCAGYMDLLEQNVFGNYRAMLEAVTLNVSMGLWLNTLGNKKENTATGQVPDENYAREVMQLFSLGLYKLNLDGTPMLDSKGQPIETYTQADITGLSYVFTGWTYGQTRVSTDASYVRVPMALPIAANHSAKEKSFLGVTIPAGTDGIKSMKTALDTIANHPNVAPFISKQLIQRLVCSNPSPAYVGRVAAVFNNNGQGVRGDLKAVMRAVLLDTEARDESKLADPTWGKVREPMLRFVQWARTFKATSASSLWSIGNTSDPATRLGQSPMRSPSVFNFFRPGYVPPNSELGNRGLLAPELQLTNESSTIGYINYMQSVVSTGTGTANDVKSVYADWLVLANDVNALVDKVALLLSASQLSADTIAKIRTAVASITVASDSDRLRRVQAAVLLVMASTEYIVQK